MFDNQHLFHLINAAPGLSGWPLAPARWIAIDLIYALPLLMVWGWLFGDHVARRELLQMLLSTAIALAFAQVVTHAWPQPRPAALHLGTQYLAHAADPGLPSDHVTVFWSLAFAAFMTRRFGVWSMPLMTAGLVVGWSRVYLGVHFPYDIAAALPVSLLGAMCARALRKPARPAVARILRLYDRFAERVSARWSRHHKA